MAAKWSFVPVTAPRINVDVSPWFSSQGSLGDLNLTEKWTYSLSPERHTFPIAVTRRVLRTRSTTRDPADTTTTANVHTPIRRRWRRDSLSSADRRWPDPTPLQDVMICRSVLHSGDATRYRGDVPRSPRQTPRGLRCSHRAVLDSNCHPRPMVPRDRDLQVIYSSISRL